MLKVHKQALAEKDLIEILKYSYNNWGETQADQLGKSISLIAENPSIGLTCDEVRKGYRKYHVNRHIIFYRVEKDILNIIRVLVDNMDYISHL